MPRQFRFDREDFDAEQLRWDLEDYALVQMGESFPGDITEGSINTHGGKSIVVTIYEEGDAAARLAPETARAPEPRDFDRLIPRVIQTHQKRPWRHRGNLSGVVTRFSPSVARIVVYDTQHRVEKSGSGFIFKNNSTVLTAAHVVDPKRYEVRAVVFGELTVKCDGIEKFDGQRDVALLRLERPLDLPVLKLRQPISFPRDLGMQCAVIGYPDIPSMVPSESVYETTLVSQKHSYLEKHRLIELSTHLGSGVSGSPVLNADFSLIGMVVGYPGSGFPGEDENGPRWTPYAVPADEISAWA